MSAEPIFAQAPDEPPTDDAIFSAALLELVDIGLRVARAVGREADRCAQASDAPKEGAAADLSPDRTASILKNLADSFDDAARAVRRTVLLARHIAQGAVPQPQAAPRAPAATRAATRRRIIREVEDTIDRKSEGEAAESLSAELSLRLDGPDLEDDIDTGRPIPDIIADIRRDLGLSGNHRRRTPKDIQDLYARAAKPPPPPASANDPASPTSPNPKSQNRAAEPGSETPGSETPSPETPGPGTSDRQNQADPPQNLERHPPRDESPAESLLHYLTRARGT